MFQSIGKVIAKKQQPTPGIARSLQAAVIVAKATECSQGRWQALQFRSGRLTLTASSPVMAQELVLRRQDVLNTINQALGESIVTQLLIKSSCEPVSKLNW